VKIEGPVCDSSQVIGWHLRNMNNETDTITPPIHISSFAFNSSILWDPERWGRTSSVQDTSQVNFLIYTLSSPLSNTLNFQFYFYTTFSLASYYHCATHLEPKLNHPNLN